MGIIWFGVKSDDSALRERIANSARLNRTDVLTLNTIREARYKDYGKMPEKVVELLSSPWTTECTGTSVTGKTEHYRGVSLLGEADIYSPVKMKFEPKGLKTIKCPTKDMRYSEYVKVVAPEHADEPNWSFAFFFDDRAFESASSIWNVVQTIFIAFMLVVGSAGFSADA